MERFEFSIIASGLDPNADDFESRFYDGGCDDATVSFQKGHIIIDFAREAASIEEAIASAVESVRALGCHDMSEIPEDVMQLARKAIMAEVKPDVRWQYADGRCDHFAVVQAIARAILAERERSRDDTSCMVGEYHADYSELSAEELAASDPDADSLIARSRVVSSKRL